MPLGSEWYDDENVVPRFEAAVATCSREPSPLLPMLLLLTPACFDDNAFVKGVSDALDSYASLLPFYSTAVPFDVYIQRCPPELKSRGLLSHMFEKWPAGDALQQAAASDAVQKLQKQAPKPAPSWGFGAFWRRCCPNHPPPPPALESTSHQPGSRRDERDHGSLLELTSQQRA